jgi:protoporphyrinogen oxidase
MHIAIIGAGFTGLTAGLRLAEKGHTVTLFEKEAIPGGLAIGFQQRGWEWPLEKHYHHIFETDTAIRKLADDVGLPFFFRRPNTSTFIQGDVVQLDSPFKLLFFSKLSIVDRLRMGIVLAYLKYVADWNKLEGETAHAWLKKAMGSKGYGMVWEPLIKGKFGDYYKDISLAWFWARIKARTTNLGYPPGGFQNLADAVVCAIKEKGGKVMYETSVFKIHSDESGVDLFYNQGQLKKNKRFDKVLITVPNILVASLVPQLPEVYKEELRSFQWIGAVNMVLELSDEMLAGDVYWLNICDRSYPFISVVEHTHFIDKKHYHGNHIVYVGNYLPHTHRYFRMNADQLLKEYDPFLKKIKADYADSLLSATIFKVPFAQPIVTKNFSHRILPIQTPIEHVYLSNMQQVYPWDRGTNYAVEWGERAADKIAE